jgi:hypothetical protein
VARGAQPCRLGSIKEGPRPVFAFQVPVDQAGEALDRWGSSRRCRSRHSCSCKKPIVTHTPSILAVIEHGLSNGRTESVNTKVRLITGIAFGFKSPDALIARAMLNLGGHRPLPTRTLPAAARTKPLMK